ncbi:MAG: PAS domain-containing protein [Candidatus Polarisedimenticolaceae bacterium]|nr:PAS domain-containing protein [Candidatus Polarisedimenticolaceae bacterium]
MHKKNSFKPSLFIVLTMVAAAPALLVVLYISRDNLQNIALFHIGLPLIASVIIATLCSSYLNHIISHELKMISTIFSHPTDQQDDTPLQPKYAETQQLLKQANAWLIRKGRAKAALKASEERLNLALNTGGFGTWDWDLINDQLSWDSRTHRLYGLKPESFSGKYHDFLKLLHPDDRGILTKQLSSITENAEDFIHEVEYRIIRPDGTTRFLADRCEVFRSNANQIERMIGITWDITARKLAEKTTAAKQASKSNGQT